MIKLIFKFSLTFIACFIILSFKVGEKQLFFHINEYTGPIGTDIQESITKSFERTFAKSKKLFTNSEPELRDVVQSQKSGIIKRLDELEDLKEDEIKKLDELIENN